MKKIPIAASRPYEVLVEDGCLTKAGELLLPFAGGGYAAIVTDSMVDRLHAHTLERALEEANIRTVKFVFPHGEAQKNAQTYVALLEFLAEKRLTRGDLIIALGGGVVGDLAGFAAATFLRGIAFVQIPTTLLAMVDSSVGGKTAIDLAAGKNLAGAFYQPKTVLCDPTLLNTLTPSTLADGCGEVIKYGVLGSEELFSHMMEKGTAFDREPVLDACIRMKARIVQEDEFDKGTRQLLNFGHTLGHAVEKISNFSISHGSAVSIGMAGLAKCAAAEGLCAADLPAKIAAACEKCGLPTEMPYAPQAVYDAMLSDKKRDGDTLSLVLPEKIGKCMLYPLSVSALLPFLENGLR